MNKTFKGALEIKNNMKAISKIIIEEEGFSETKYEDNGRYTWGYGTLASSKKKEITKEEALIEMQAMLIKFALELDKIFGKHAYKIPTNKKIALLNMIYNLGATKFVLFKKAIEAIKSEKWGIASKEIEDSAWYKTNKNRVMRIQKEFIK